MKKLISICGIALLGISLAGCGSKSSDQSHNSKSIKSEKSITDSSHLKTDGDYFKNDVIKMQHLTLTINQKSLVQFNNHEDLRILFTIDNGTNNSINNLMNNQIIKASQKNNNENIQLPIVNETMNDTTIQKINKDNNVKSKSTAHSVMYFKLKNSKQPVTLTAYNNRGKKIGSETVDLATLKVINLNQPNNSNDQ